MAGTVEMLWDVCVVEGDDGNRMLRQPVNPLKFGLCAAVGKFGALVVL